MTSIEIKASRAVRSFRDVRVDRAKDAVDVAVVLEADLHVVAPSSLSTSSASKP